MAEFTDGEVVAQGDLNALTVLQFDETTNIDVDVTSASQDTSINNTWAIAAADIPSEARYLVIEMFGEWLAIASSDGTGDAESWIYTKIENTTDASTLLAEYAVCYARSDADSGDRTFARDNIFTYIHTLTSDNKTNGMGIKITNRGVTDADNNSVGQAKYENRHVVMRLIR